MLTQEQFASNDALDRQRVFLVLSGLAGAALGVDPGNGAPAYNGSPTSTAPGAGNLFALGTTGQNVIANVGGSQITLPVLLVLAVGAWLVLK